MAKNGKGLDPETLYWSERGSVACGDHAPLKGSDTWLWDRWSKVPKGVGLKCEHGGCGRKGL